MEDAEQRRDRTVDTTADALQRRAARGVDRDRERGSGAPDELRRRRVGIAALIRDRERSDGFPQLAQAARLGLRDRLTDEPLLAQPRRRLLGRADAIPVGWQIVVMGVDEALEQLESPRRLRPPSGLDLLADPPLVALLHY